MKLDILICGIGGQGVVLLGNFVRQYLLSVYNSAYIVGTESRGVSQREGSVISTVRIDTEGNSLFGPEIPQHEADIIIGMEPIEVLRNIKYAHNDTVLIFNRNAIIPKNMILEELKPKSKELTKMKDSINFHDSQEIVAKILSIYQKLPSNYKKNKLPLKNDSKDSFDIKFPDLMKVKSISTVSKVIDLDLTNLMLKQFGSTSSMNFVFLGIITFILDEFDYEHISKFIQQFFKTSGKKQDFLEKNITSLQFGNYLAYLSKKKSEN